MDAPSRPAPGDTCAPAASRRALCLMEPCIESLFPSLLNTFIPQVKRVFCESSGALVPKDKAVKRFIVRNIVESAAIRDLQESCVFDCASRHAHVDC